MTIRFTVYGRPAPQGSSRAFTPKGWSHSVITSDNKKLKPWRQQMSGAAMALGVPGFPAGTPIAVWLDFYFAKPKSAKKRRFVTVKPDVDKLTRACLDSITGILIHDDAQVVHVTARKHYGDPERVEIQVSEAK